MFVSCFLIISLGVVMYGIVQVGESIVRAELGEWWKKRNMSEKIGRLEKHFVICGAGRMGQMLCEDLAQRGIEFVVIDRDEEALAPLRDRGWPTIRADATDDQTLTDAGIERCAGLATVLASDADNLFVVLSARLLSPSVQIVARSHDEQAARKLTRAGANRVVSPYESGATKMGQLLTNPQLNDFVEIVTDKNISFDLFGIPASTNPAWQGCTLSETNLRNLGVMVVAIRRKDGSVIVAPPARDSDRSGRQFLRPG